MTSESFTAAISSLIILVLFGLIATQSLFIAIVFILILLFSFFIYECYDDQQRQRVQLSELPVFNEEYYTAIMKAYYYTPRPHALNMDN